MDPAPMSAPDQARFRAEALPCLDDVARFARWLARDPADADDLVQETFLRAFRSWSTYQPRTGCRSWLFTICRNVHLRQRERADRVVTAEDAELEALAAAAVHAALAQAGDADLFERAELRAVVRQKLELLPEIYREAVVLVDLEELDYAGAAGVLGVPVGTLRSRLFRGRRLLQEELIDYAREAGLVPGGEPGQGTGR